MKKVILSLILLVTVIYYGPASLRHISLEEALSNINIEFHEYTAEYYQILDRDSLNWRLFVDLYPTQMWCHDCCVVTVPRYLEETENTLPMIKEMRISPGSLRLKSLSGHPNKVMYKDNPANEGEMILSVQNPYAAHTYVIILNGGQDQLGNCMASWNTCSYMYKTLRNKYGIAKSHIYTLMADGQDPADDMAGSEDHPGNWSQNLDLDSAI